MLLYRLGQMRNHKTKVVRLEQGLDTLVLLGTHMRISSGDVCLVLPTCINQLLATFRELQSYKDDLSKLITRKRSSTWAFTNMPAVYDDYYIRSC